MGKYIETHLIKIIINALNEQENNTLFSILS